MYTSFIFCFLLLNIFLAGHAQNIDSLLSLHRQADPQEKIYIHFDKSYYNPGETIWFKAYIFDGIERSLLTKNFYAELTDENGNVLKRLTAPVEESSAAGSFDLAANLSKNTLYFRAYTAAMLNGEDTSFFYIKPIHIITPVKTVKTKAPLSVTISFLPEGGDLTAGLQSVMAFKVTDQNGLPVAAKGYIKGSDGNKITDFATVHNGMGSFKIEPRQGQAYTAVWKDGAGKEYTSALPAIKDQGISLQLSNAAEGKKFILQRSEGADEAGKSLRIIAYMNQQLVYYAKVNLTASFLTSGIIPTKQLPSGIIQVTVFDKNLKPLAERVSFVNNHDYEFDVDAWIPALNKSKRGLNTVEVLVSDTFRSNLSLSVTDADLNVPSANEDNIITHLLLTGDLRGKVINPYYYFFSTSDSAAIYLDLVMLTHGWRRYNWDNVLAGKLPPLTIKESNYLSIQGKVIGVLPGQFPPDARLSGILQTKDSSKQFLSLQVNRKGEVFTDGFVFFDYAKMYFQFSDKKLIFDKSLLHVDNGLHKANDFIILDEENKNAAINLDTNLVAKNIKISSDELKVAVLRNKKEQVLQEVIVKGKVKTNIEKMDEKYASGMFSGGDSHNFDVANDPFGASSFSVFQYLQGKVAGLQISNASGGQPSLSWRGGTPVFYLDEMPADAGLISSINMSDVAYIKVFSPGASGGISSSGGGAISIYTKKGSDANKTKGKGLDYVQLTGYTPIKQFYSPDFATSSALNDLPDLRTTLYWNPYIILDKSKKRFKVQFYNNDITHRFRIVLEGINANDKLTRVEKVIE
jgi:hypothetical protein